MKVVAERQITQITPDKRFRDDGVIILKNKSNLLQTIKLVNLHYQVDIQLGLQLYNHLFGSRPNSAANRFDIKQMHQSTMGSRG